MYDIISKGADFLLLPIYLKALSQSEYGQYTYLIFIILTISGVLKLGLDTAVSKMYYETEKYNRGTLLFTANIIWISFFIIIAGISFITGLDKYFFIKLMEISIIEYSNIRVFVFIYILFYLIQSTLNVFFVINEDPLRYQKYNFIRILGGHSLILILLYFTTNVNKAFLRFSVESAFFCISLIGLISYFFRQMKILYNKEIARECIKIGLPVAFTLVLNFVYNLSDKYFLQSSKGYETLAVYNLGIALTTPATMVFTSFQTIWFPRFLQITTNDDKYLQSKSIVIKFVKVYLLLFIIMSLGILLLFLLNALPGNYISIFYIFPLVFLSKVSDSLMQIYNNFIVIWGKTYFNLIVTLVLCISTLILNYLFIPEFGVKAATFILFSISLLRFYLYFIYVKKNI